MSRQFMICQLDPAFLCTENNVCVANYSFLALALYMESVRRMRKHMKQSSMDQSVKKESHFHQKKYCRLLLFPLPLQGHITPMLQLANILYSKGFSITIIHTQFNSPNRSNYPDFFFQPIPEGLFEHEASAADVVKLVTLLNIRCFEPFRDSVAKLLVDAKDQEPVSCLITDADWYFTQDVADSLKLPRIVLRTSNVCSFLVFDVLPVLRDKGYLPVKESQLEEFIPELEPLKVKDLPEIETQNLENFYYLVASMVSKTKASSGLIWNTVEDLEHDALLKCQDVFGVPVFQVGPFHKFLPASSGSSLLTQDLSSISWLDKHAPKSVLYVSFGSIAAISEAEFLEIAWGLANSKQPFLWVVRPGSVRGSEWLEPLPHGFLEMVSGRGHIVKWAPQQDVLAHPATGGFWTHCGWNSTFESICEGIPMICQPSFGDQKVNARYVSDVWKIGIHLENKLERREIERAIKKLMLEKNGQEIRERIISLKEQVDLCPRQGGSSCRSLDSLISHVLSFYGS